MTKPSDRSIRVGGAVSGSVLVTGDKNTVSLASGDAAPSDRADVLRELEAVRELLQGMTGPDAKRVTNAVEEAIDEARAPEPRKDVVAGSLERALELAVKAGAVAEQIDKLRERLGGIVRWLGPSFAGLLRLVGL